jgi:hypothetical protein
VRPSSPWGDRRTVALAATVPPSSDGELVAELEEAVVSTTRAVLAAGGALALAADATLGGLVAAVAAEYALPRAAEVSPEHRPPPRLRLFGPSREGDAHDELLTSFAARGVASLEGERGAQDRETHDRSIRRLLETVEPVGALVAGPPDAAEQDIRSFRDRVVRIAAIVPGADPELLERLGVRDPVREALRWEVDEERPHGEPIRPDVTPYPFVLQLLVAEWLDEERVVGV